MLERLDGLRSSGGASVSRIIGEMLLGLEFIHSQGIVHRDLKPGNFLLGGEDGQTIKICDFGLAAVMPEEGQLFRSCGSPSYMSPEVVAKTGYTTKTDVWSLGATLYVLLYGALPYVKPNGDNREAIKLGLPAPKFQVASDVRHAPQEGATSLVRQLLERCQHKRCTAAEALQHEFVQVRSCKCAADGTKLDISDSYSTEPGSENSTDVTSSSACSVGGESSHVSL